MALVIAVNQIVSNPARWAIACVRKTLRVRIDVSVYLINARWCTRVTHWPLAASEADETVG